MATDSTCTNCGTRLELEASFCAYCGQATASMAAELSGTGPRSGQVRLTFTGTGLEALGWGLFALILGMLIIPACWGVAAISRWLVHSLTLDNGATVEFHGMGGQLWGYSILMFFIQAVSNLIPRLGGVIAWLVNSRIQLVIWQWFFREVHMSNRGNLGFTGQYWPYVGWSLLLFSRSSQSSDGPGSWQAICGGHTGTSTWEETK